MTTKIKGQLEIDNQKGIIYFHANERKTAGSILLRIRRLPIPIPSDIMLDITMGVGGKWEMPKTKRMNKTKKKETK